MAQPDRALARVVLAMAALVGLLGLVQLLLLDLAIGSAETGVRSVRCFVLPITSVDAVVHGAMLASGALLAAFVVSAVRAWTRQRAVAAELRLLTRLARHRELPPRVAGVAEAAGVRRSLDVLDGASAFAFTYGWLRPRIAISTGLIDRLTDAELAAVLHHEDWHRRRRDPARLLLVQTLTAPVQRAGVGRRLVRSYLLAIEVAADCYAVGRTGQRQWLAGALRKTLDDQPISPSFAGNVDGRVAALAGDPVAAPAGVGRLAALLVAGEALAILDFLRFDGIPLHAVLALVHPWC
jgi:Zn-dependent protease with chaperone function